MRRITRALCLLLVALALAGCGNHAGMTAAQACRVERCR